MKPPPKTFTEELREQFIQEVTNWVNSDRQVKLLLPESAGYKKPTYKFTGEFWNKVLKSWYNKLEIHTTWNGEHRATMGVLKAITEDILLRKRQGHGA
jgi:hypothetical protein